MSQLTSERPLAVEFRPPLKISLKCSAEKVLSGSTTAIIDKGVNDLPPKSDVKLAHRNNATPSQSPSRNVDGNRLTLKIDLRKAQLPLNKNQSPQPATRTGIQFPHPWKVYQERYRNSEISKHEHRQKYDSKKRVHNTHHSYNHNPLDHNEYPRHHPKKIIISQDKSSIPQHNYSSYLDSTVRTYNKREREPYDYSVRDYCKLYIGTLENKYKRTQNDFRKNVKPSVTITLKTNGTDTESVASDSVHGVPTISQKKPLVLNQDKKHNKKTWNSKKKDPHEVYRRVVSSLKQRDHYGFFLKPVDTNVFTDYTSIVTAPMDLGRMNEKVVNREYNSIFELRADLELLVSNAKKYNAVESAYYKSAVRLWEWGSRLIDKIADTLASDESQRSCGDATKTAGKVQVKRRRKLLLELESRLRDTRHPDYTLKSSSKQESKKYCVFGKHLSKYISSFMNCSVFTSDFLIDNEPIALSIHTYSLTPPNEQQKTLNNDINEGLMDIYGGNLGLVYARNLGNFTRNLESVVRDECWKKANYSTKGCYNILRKSTQLLSSDIKLGASLINGTALVETEYGKINLASKLGEMNSKLLEPQRIAQIEQFRLNGIDATPLTTPIVQKFHSVELSEEVDSLSLDQMLQRNILDIASYLQTSRCESSYPQKLTESHQLMEKIRQRLLVLVKKVSPSQQFVRK